MRTPVFNCTESRTAAYATYNATTYSVVEHYYFPYNEEYYKLSVVQGVPYAQSNTSTSFGDNTQCKALTGAIGPSSYGMTATYMGDETFGINTWNPDASGDMQTPTQTLTNGMKALGASDYNATRGQFWNWSAHTFNVDISGATYPVDDMNYQGPLNPTAASTDGSGIPDTDLVVAADPMSPVALALNLTWASDYGCDLGATGYNPPQDAISAEVSSDATPVLLYTPLVTAYSGGVQCSGGESDWNFNFNDNYLLPVDNDKPDYNLTLNLWHEYDVSGNSRGTAVASTPLALGSAGSNSVDGNFEASWWITPLSRAHTILMNGSSEVANLTGYGYRYTGEQQFYVTYLNVYGSSSGYGPLTPGLNIILESRSSFQASNFSSAVLQNNGVSNGYPGYLSFLDNSTFTARGTEDTTQQVVASLWANVTGPQGMVLLDDMLPRSSAGNISGSYLPLDNNQVDLLGLAPVILDSIPLVGIAGYDSPIGSAPITLLHETETIAVSGAVFFAEAVVFVVLAPVIVVWDICGELSSWCSSAEQSIYDCAMNLEACWQHVQAAAEWLGQEFLDVATIILEAILEFVFANLMIVMDLWDAGLRIQMSALWAASNETANLRSEGVYPGSGLQNVLFPISSLGGAVTTFADELGNVLSSPAVEIFQGSFLTAKISSAVSSVLTDAFSSLAPSVTTPNSLQNVLSRDMSSLYAGDPLLVLPFQNWLWNETNNLTSTSPKEYSNQVESPGYYSYLGEWAAAGSLLVSILSVAFPGSPGQSSTLSGDGLEGASTILAALGLAQSAITLDSQVVYTFAEGIAPNCQSATESHHVWTANNNASYYQMLNFTSAGGNLLSFWGVVAGSIGALIGAAQGANIPSLVLGGIGVILGLIGLVWSFDDGYQVYHACSTGGTV